MQDARCKIQDPPPALEQGVRNKAQLPPTGFVIPTEEPPGGDEWRNPLKEREWEKRRLRYGDFGGSLDSSQTPRSG